jgi:hypothetical protein
MQAVRTAQEINSALRPQLRVEKLATMSRWGCLAKPGKQPVKIPQMTRKC